MDSAPGARKDAPASDLAARLERVMAFLAASEGASCDRCEKAFCGHAALMSYAAGHADAPLCLPCLAEEAGRAAEGLRDEVAGYILRKDCLSRAWSVTTAREGFAPLVPPPCLWPGDGGRTRQGGGSDDLG